MIQRAEINVELTPTHLHQLPRWIHPTTNAPKLIVEHHVARPTPPPSNPHQPTQHLPRRVRELLREQPPPLLVSQPIRQLCSDREIPHEQVEILRLMLHLEAQQLPRRAPVDEHPIQHRDVDHRPHRFDAA